ncbi:MAG: NGG1p interacting factor NIF3 [Candidatus Omnitrophota bacterium]
MKLKSLYALIIKLGMDKDPRGKTAVEKELKQLNKHYQALNAREKEEFDTERLVNPYSDTRILFGTGKEEVKNVLLGIDIDVSEVILADRLKEKGKKIDLIVAHHPEGRALASLYEVMYMQVDLAHLKGVPITVAESLMQNRINEVERRLLPVNHAKTADAARILNIPLMSLHTPADNHVTSFLEHVFNKEKPHNLGQIIDTLKSIPEYQNAVKNNAGPKIFNGNNNSRAGGVFVDMTGGTEGSREIFKNLAAAGVGTIVGMHLSEEHLKKAKKEHINVIIAGHIASDNLGLNLILDSIEKKQKLNILNCSGFERIRRK